MRALKAIARGLLALFSSLGMSAALIMILALLTWLGTLEQTRSSLYDVVNKYFTSWGFIHDSGPFPVPLPGGNTILALLCVNLVVGGLIRLRRGWDMAGIFVTHVGILMLILSGAGKLWLAEEGHVTLYEGDRSEQFQSYYDVELIVREYGEDGLVTERAVDSAHFQKATGAKPYRLESESLPFDLELRHYASNSGARRKGPMFDVDVPVEEGLFLEARPREMNAEANQPGVHVTVRPHDGSASRTAWTWALELAPFAFDQSGRTYTIELRKQRYPMPFGIQLDEFTKVDHPRTGMPKSFSSLVTVTESGTSRPVLIEMNKPLRTGSFVVYQASWGPSNARPGDRLFSTLAVVRNPTDQYPLYSLGVITLGLIVHFLMKLGRHASASNAKAKVS